MSKEGLNIGAENTAFTPEVDPVSGKSRDELYAHGNDILAEMRRAYGKKDFTRVEELKKHFADIQQRANAVESSAAPEAPESPEAPEASEADEPVYSENAEAGFKGEMASMMESLPEEDKQEVTLGLSNAGYLMTEVVDRKLAGFMDSFVSTNLHEDNFSSRWAKGLSNSYTKDADAAREKAANVGGLKGNLKGMATGAGTATKWFRIISDLTTHHIASPWRYVMMGGAFVARNGDAFKEAVLNDNDIADKTRIADADTAAEEAWKLYEKSAQGDGEVSAEDLKQTYLRDLPKELIARLEAEKPELNAQERVRASIDGTDVEPGLARRMVEGAVKKDMQWELERLQSNLEKIDSEPGADAEDKEARRQKLLSGMSDRLADYDRIIGEYGTVSLAAMAGRWAKTAGKTAVYAATAETLAVGAEKLFGSIASLFTHHAEAVSAIPEAGVRDVLSAKADTSNAVAGDIDKMLNHSTTEPLTPEMQEFMKNPLGSQFFPHVDAATSVETPITPHVETPAFMEPFPKPITADEYFGRVEPSLPHCNIETHGGFPGLKPEQPGSELLKNPFYKTDPSEFLKTSASTPEISGLPGGDIAAAHAAETVDSHTEIVHQGGSITKTIDQMVKEGKITEAQAHLARNNPLSGGLVKGERLNIDKLWLSHEGDQVKFVEGVNGANPHFEVVEGTGGHLGTQADLEAAKVAEGIHTGGAHVEGAATLHSVPVGDVNNETVDEALNQVTSDSQIELAHRIAEMHPTSAELHLSVSEFLKTHEAAGANVHEAARDAKFPLSYSDKLLGGESALSYDGSYKFSYDHAGNPESLLIEGHSTGIKGTEFLKSGAHPEAGSLLASQNQTLIPQIKIFESMAADASRNKEASFLLENIRHTFKTMSDKYGRDAFDVNKVPSYARDIFDGKKSFLSRLLGR